MGGRKGFFYRSCDSGIVFREDGFSYSSNFCDVFGVGFFNVYFFCSFKLIYDEEWVNENGVFLVFFVIRIVFYIYNNNEIDII